MMSDAEGDGFILNCENQGPEIATSLSPNSTKSMEPSELVPSKLPITAPTTSTKIVDETSVCESEPIPSTSFADYIDLEPIPTATFADDQSNYLQYLQESVSQSTNLNSTASVKQPECSSELEPIPSTSFADLGNLETLPSTGVLDLHDQPNYLQYFEESAPQATQIFDFELGCESILGSSSSSSLLDLDDEPQIKKKKTDNKSDENGKFSAKIFLFNSDQ